MSRRSDQMNRLRERLDAHGDAIDVDLIPAWMSAREWVELSALVESYKVLDHPSMMHVSHREFYLRMRNHGLVLWQWPHPEHGKKFASVRPSDVAVKLVEALG